MFTRQSRNKKWCLTFFVLILMLVLTACPALSDWAYELPNDYAIIRVNSERVVLTKSENYTTIDSFIVEFCYNETHIAIKRIVPDIPENEIFHIDSYEYDESDVEYYIVEMLTDTLYGPYDHIGYSECCQQLKVEELSEWIKTAEIENGTYRNTGDGSAC